MVKKVVFGAIDTTALASFAAQAAPMSPASKRWQAVALEVTEGVGKAVLLLGSMVAGIVLSVVLAAMAASHSDQESINAVSRSNSTARGKPVLIMGIECNS